MRHISSSITDGLSVTTIQFALETNTDRALNDIKDAVTRVRANLPQNVNEPLIQRVDVIGLPIVTYAAISPGKTPEQLSYFVDDVVKRALQGVRGVAQVERIGGVEREILVSLDPDRLQAAGLTAVNVSQILRGTNVDLAGGRAEIGKNDQAIRTLAGAKTLNELAGTMIPLFGGGEVRLDDLGTVTDTIADRRTFARFNGEPVVALGIKRSKGASDVVVAAAVQKRIDALKVAYPDVDLKLIDTSVDFTKGNYEAAISTLFEGAILAVIIVLLFLRDIRATIIAAISLPLSIFPAFWVMDLLGFSLNLVSFPRDHAVDRHSGRRRHRRDREHRPPHADGQVALSRRAGSRRRNRPRRDRDLADHHRDLRAGELHVRHRRAVLQAVRHHRVGAGVLLAARRALRHAGAGGLFPQGSPARRPAARARPADLHQARDLVGEALLHHRADRLRRLRGLDLEHHAAAAGLPAGAGHRALAAGDGAAAGLAARLHREGDRGNRRAPAQAARGEERVRRRRPRAAGHAGGAPRRADHQLHAERRSQDHPARSSSSRSARNSKTFPTSASGSSTKTACARSRWS